MSTARRLRAGIAGAGWVASDRHLPCLMARDDIEIAAIFDPTLSRAHALASRMGTEGSTGRLCHDHLDDFFANDLDLVHVTSSPWSHHDIAIGALESGAHVFTEKPMAMSLTQAEGMAEAARRANRLLCVSHNFLWSHAMRKARRKIGTAPVDYVLGVQMSSPRRRLPTWYERLPGGLMFDEAPHMLYSLTNLLGGGLRLDHARGSFDEAGHPQTVEVLVRGRTGHGQVTMVFCSPVSEWHIMASSRVGVVDLDLFRDIATFVGPDGAHSSLDIAHTSLSAVAGHTAGFASAGARWVAKRQFWGHDALIGAFIDAIQKGGGSPVSIESALGVVALTDDLLATLGLTPAGVQS